jgi:hypothetical protein
MLLTKYFSGDEIKKNEIGWARGMYGREDKCIIGFGGSPERNREIGRPRHRWRDNNKKHFIEKYD